jgi:ATP-dependent DNA helicase RecQ
MCRALPDNRMTFARITGVGERKLEKYGDAFLQVIAHHFKEAASEQTTAE